DPAEGGEGPHRAKEIERELEARRHEEAQVLRDALVGIVGAGLDDLHEVVGARGEPVADPAIREPPPPAGLDHLAHVEAGDSGCDVARRARYKGRVETS